MVKLNIRKYFELPDAGAKVAEFEVKSMVQRVLGKRYQVVTHRDVLAGIMPTIGTDIPVGNHQKGFRDAEEARDYFEFNCWKLQHPGVTPQSLHHTE